MGLLHWVLCKLTVHSGWGKEFLIPRLLQMSRFWVISVAQDHLHNLKSIVLFNYKKTSSKVICISVTIDVRGSQERVWVGFFSK